MNLKKLEKAKDKLRVEVGGEDHTLLNLLREKAWQAKAAQASYTIEHPYLSLPVITIRAANPQKTLTDAAQLVIDDVAAFQKAFKAAMRK